jgi:hypothetical protein
MDRLAHTIKTIYSMVTQISTLYATMLKKPLNIFCTATTLLPLSSTMVNWLHLTNPYPTFLPLLLSPGTLGMAFQRGSHPQLAFVALLLVPYSIMSAGTTSA